MARRYRNYRRRRSDPLTEALGLLVLIGVVAIWQWQQHTPGAVVYIWIIIIVLAATAVAFTIWQFLKKQRRLRALDISGVDTMDPLDFERYVALLLQNQGFSNVELTEKYDYGVDIIAHKDGVIWGVQVKRYNNMIKAEAVRQVVTALVRYRCNRAMVITNYSVFSKHARDLAADNNCVLVGRDELSRWIVQFQTSRR